MTGHPFNETIKSIYNEWRSRNIAIRAMGVDPILYAWNIIEAWETYQEKIPGGEKSGISKSTEEGGKIKYWKKEFDHGGLFLLLRSLSLASLPIIS